MRHLENKVVVITGAASGIGEALARGLANRGAHLALVDIDRAGLERVGAELAPLAGRVSLHTANVSDRARMEALPAEVIAKHGAVDVLINNAGVTIGAHFADHSIDDAEWLLGINVMGVVYGTKFFLPTLRASDDALIVNLSSMFGIFSMPGQAMYSASKAAVRGFTEALFTELDGTSVRLLSVHPGAIRTNVIRSARGMDADAKGTAVDLQERFGMPVDKAAAKILRAMEKDKRRLLIGVDAHIGVFLKRLFPIGFQRVLTLAFRFGNRS